MFIQRPSSCVAPLLVAFLAAAASAQTTWHVDVQATPPGDGSAGAPYSSIAYALSRPSTVHGDTILVAPGSYIERINMHQGLVLRATHGPAFTRIINASTPSQQLETVNLFHANSVLEGFTVQGVQGLTALSPGVLLWNGATVRRCVVVGFDAWAGIEIIDGKVNHCTVIGNRFGLLGTSHFGGTVELTNSIVAYNSQADFHNPTLLIGSYVSYSAGLDGDPAWLTAGPGNLPGDPLLHFLAYGEARLQAGSPCIDAASPSSPPDPDGSPADMGALPFDAGHVPGPRPYCVGKLHSEGCVAVMDFEGQASLTSPQPFLIKASLLPARQFGLLFYGLGQREVPLFGGTHCIQLPTWRSAIVFSGGAGPCSGAFELDFNAWLQAQAHWRFVPGTAVFAQWAFRDPADPSGHAIGLSNALEFHIAP